MSFNKLLAVGKSFIGIKSGPGPFKMTQESLLPQFTAGEGQPVTEVKAEVVQAPEQKPESRGAAKIVKAGFFSKVARRVENAPLVQAELKLENVRVVRNDLEDTDLEVIFAKGLEKETVSLPVTRPQPVPPWKNSKGLVWNKFTTRLFEANHSRE